MWTRSTLPGRKDLHVGNSAVPERLSYIHGKVDRRGARHEIGDGALSVPASAQRISCAPLKKYLSPLIFYKGDKAITS